MVGNWPRLLLCRLRATRANLTELVGASGQHWPDFAQGAMFAIAARSRADVVPPHTERACRFLFWSYRESLPTGQMKRPTALPTHRRSARTSNGKHAFADVASNGAFEEAHGKRGSECRVN